MNFTKTVSSIVLALSLGSVASAQWSGSGLSVGIGGGWSKSSWSGNGGRGGSVTNSYINGGIGYTQNSGYYGGGGGGGGYYGGGGGYYGGGGGYYGGGGGGYYGGGGYPVIIPYSPFTNTWGSPCYVPQIYGPVCNPCNPYAGQFIVR